MSGAASNGPAMAPIECTARSNPKGRPSWPGATLPASTLSREGALPPRATHDTARATARKGQGGAGGLARAAVIGNSIDDGGAPPRRALLKPFPAAGPLPDGVGDAKLRDEGG